MQEEQLKAYILKLHQEGLPKEEVIKRLISVGYTQEQIALAGKDITDNSEKISETEPSKTPTNGENTSPEAKPPQDKPQIKYPPLLWERTQSAIKEIESKIPGKALIYYTSKESQIADEDVEYFYTHLKTLGKHDIINLILISSGGSGMAAWRIANLLRDYCNTLQVIVPSRCASAATMLALSADKITMSPTGYLTSIDTSITHPLNPLDKRGRPVGLSLDEILRAAKDLKMGEIEKHMFDYIHPVVWGALKRSEKLSEIIANNMLSMHREDPTLNTEIINKLNQGYPTHGYPLVYRELKNFGLPIEKTHDELNDILFDLTRALNMISKVTMTNVSHAHDHLEAYMVNIESSDNRTMFIQSFDKFFVNGGWQNENDRTGWVVVTKEADKIIFKNI